MKNQNTNTNTSTPQTLHKSAAEMSAATAAAAVTPANFGITPDTAISPAFTRAAAAAAATGDDRAAAALTAAATVYKKMAVAAMARAYIATTHSPMAVYVDPATATAYVGDTAALVAATAGISCTSASRDRMGRTETRLICRESGARRWGKSAATAAFPVDIAAAAAAFPTMDAGKQREHAAARALGVYDHVPDDIAFYLSSDIITPDGVGYTCKSGSGACFAPASALWAGAIHHKNAAAAAMLTAAAIIPVRHAAAMGRLHFPRLSAADLYAVQQSAMLVAAASGLLYREIPHGVRISALHGVIDVSFDLD